MSGKKKTPKVDLSGVSRPADRAVLDILTSKGDDLSNRRHTILFFYRRKGDDRAASKLFDSLIARAAALGLNVSRRDDEALILEGYKLVDPENLEALSQWCEDMASEAGVDFDGWECALEAGPQPN